MKTLRATLAALMLMAILAVPALAEGDTGSSGDMVTKTFELTVDGTPPADAAFGVFYLEESELEEGADPETGGTFVVVCGDLSQLPPEERAEIPEEDIVSGEACVGDGHTYSFEREFARGTRLAFLFARLSVTDEETFQIFYTSVEDPSRIERGEDPLPEDFETLNTNSTNSAWYTFSGAADDQQEMPTDMPDTGAGALSAGSGLPWGTLAATLSLLVAGGCAAARRH